VGSGKVLVDSRHSSQCTLSGPRLCAILLILSPVPPLVQERKHQWAEEEERRRAALPDPDCPPGMRLLTDEERCATIGVWVVNIRGRYVEPSQPRADPDCPPGMRLLTQEERCASDRRSHSFRVAVRGKVYVDSS
jgi:hypothetical protein